MKFVLRSMREEDLPDAVAITTENFAQDGKRTARYEPARVRERLASSFAGDDFAPRFVVAVKHDGELVGVAGWGRIEIATATWGLFLSSVNREYRGKGLGTALVVERLGRISEEADRGRVLVSTGHRKRFERFGFRSVDYDEERSLHLMLKRLDRT